MAGSIDQIGASLKLDASQLDFSVTSSKGSKLIMRANDEASRRAWCTALQSQIKWLEENKQKRRLISTATTTTTAAAAAASTTSRSTHAAVNSSHASYKFTPGEFVAERKEGASAAIASSAVPAAVPAGVSDIDFYETPEGDTDDGGEGGGGGFGRIMEEEEEEEEAGGLDSPPAPPGDANGLSAGGEAAAGRGGGGEGLLLLLLPSEG